MAQSVNFCVHLATLGHDPELKQTPSGKAVCSIRAAVNKYTRPGEENQPDWFDYVTWGATAEYVSKYLKKGSRVLITSEAHTRSYTDKNGTKITKVEFTVKEIENLTPNKSAKPSTPTAVAGGYTDDGSDDFEELSEDDELPF